MRVCSARRWRGLRHGGLAEAVAGGADRIELCAALALGGLTPSVGLIELAMRCGVPVVAMIRPRAGDFTWSEVEVAMMEAEIATVRTAGLHGVVLGASLPDGRLDLPVLLRLTGRAAWWVPRWLGRILPDIHFSHG